VVRPSAMSGSVCRSTARSSAPEGAVPNVSATFSCNREAAFRAPRSHVPQEESLKSIQTSIEVAAPSDVVWQVVEDFASYGEWNPFVIGISGEQRVGARLDVLISIGGKRMQFQPRIVEWQPGRSLRWLGRVFAGWLFCGEHGLAVEPLPGGRTRFVHDEVFHGIAVPFIPRMLRTTDEGFRSMNAALKQRVELARGGRLRVGAPQRRASQAQSTPPAT
jgi:hypothetical protein